jgi:hemerythrin-like domain-containing protein
VFSERDPERENEMKATDLLKQQHDEVKELFEKIEDAPRAATKRQLFEELAANLVAHDGIERELFYPACEENMGMTDLLGEALVEHGLVEFSLYQADQALGDDDFEYKLTVLKEALEHHIDEEEGELFPKVNRAFGKELLETLGGQMEQKFEELKEGDFRAPLRGNLKQVLQGVLKPTPKAKSSGARGPGASSSKPRAANRKSGAPPARKAPKKRRSAARRG